MRIFLLKMRTYDAYFSYVQRPFSFVLFFDIYHGISFCALSEYNSHRILYIFRICQFHQPYVQAVLNHLHNRKYEIVCGHTQGAPLSSNIQFPLL